MQIVLRTDQANLGKRGDIVNVADGYARNFLIPRGHAIKATPGIKAQADSMRRSRDLKDKKAREGAEEIAKRLAGATVVVGGNASHEGKLYGSVGIPEIIEAIEKSHSVTLERRSILLVDHIREVGDHTVEISLHPQVRISVTVSVTE
ncbi:MULTISPECIES: 50S ribosomal protein L9 [Acidithrix]|jgi:large subunit ribosomal protein L9|uniref:Large ribosomal subunit protein bL9 n=1 Tax=Acidithrix ferrooxidans TaxID=1280514 RepID=A0A0D8HG00_9ACTN|nr:MULTISPECIES: 50S ribosomal protein L9 [Acidithrix]KJF16732.1 50S ribosomal protein L9 [Acidithrix ferrooxidans]CAG4934352.1 unnamed protein product [Acidithrix sp. C25]